MLRGSLRFLLECFAMPDTSPFNLMHLMDRFSTDEKCRDFLEELRWPGARCPARYAAAKE